VARPAPTVVAPAPDTSIDPTLDELLEAALSGTRSAPTTTAALPAMPPQREVAAALRALERDVAMCRDGEGGTISTRVTVEGATGRVTDVDVAGDAVRGAVAACGARAVETARFPRFANERFVVAFPYRI
jgi:N-acetylglutamate synthase/N-acetylornithine aminotransferase